MTAKTSTERSDTRAKRLESEGFKLMRNFWIKANKVEFIKDYADKQGITPKSKPKRTGNE